ncbi:hypothetical protein [Streptomyces xiaopingdaonensis]|uniref:hypothetical protein n=1 Tax=Streptomyces xiaopingdaonensis TaxID=1565415 RepID=UPI000382E265|nr:hypothetical protein [Streptomyces xiaopingdaonensis]
MTAAERAPQARTPAVAVRRSRPAAESAPRRATPSMGELLASCAAARTVSTPPEAPGERSECDAA